MGLLIALISGPFLLFGILALKLEAFLIGFVIAAFGWWAIAKRSKYDEEKTTSTIQTPEEKKKEEEKQKEVLAKEHKVAVRHLMAFIAIVVTIVILMWTGILPQGFTALMGWSESVGGKLGIGKNIVFIAVVTLVAHFIAKMADRFGGKVRDEK